MKKLVVALLAAALGVAVCRRLSGPCGAGSRRSGSPGNGSFRHGSRHGHQHGTPDHWPPVVRKPRPETASAA